MNNQSLTPMQSFAMELVKKDKKLNTGQFPPCASRDSFGLTSAAYRTLRKLAEKGLLTSDDREYTFQIKKP